MDIQVKIIQILPVISGQNKSGNDWKKQLFIGETTDSQYPKKIAFNLWGNKVDEVKLTEGQLARVHFDVESREYNNNWYTDIKVWRIDSVEAANANQANPTQTAQASNFSEPIKALDSDGDLPF
ncbi:MAG: DUF3127 domain-containing protein [Chitinophagales bacterium]|jgi:hypothetical protein|nr:DUF3127 domain-containing protein [Chitinophagales bacterium]